MVCGSARGSARVMGVTARDGGVVRYAARPGFRAPEIIWLAPMRMKPQNAPGNSWAITESCVISKFMGARHVSQDHRMERIGLWADLQPRGAPSLAELGCTRGAVGSGLDQLQGQAFCSSARFRKFRQGRYDRRKPFMAQTILQTFRRIVRNNVAVKLNGVTA